MRRILFSCVMIASALSFFSCKDEPEEVLCEWIPPHTFTTIKDAREVWVSGTEWIGGYRLNDSFEMTDTLIEGRPYLLMLRNGQRTNVCIRVERDRIFGYNPNDGSEFMMYDFSKKPHREEPFEVTLFFEHTDGSVEPMTYHADFDYVNDFENGSMCFELCLDGEFWPNATDWGFSFNGIFHGIRYFKKTREKLIAHCFPLISEDGKIILAYYTEYLGVDICPLVVAENDKDSEQGYSEQSYWCDFFKVPGKGYENTNNYVECDGVIDYEFFYGCV